MPAPLKTALFAFALFVFASLSALAQPPAPQATPPDDAIKVFTEEVRLSVTAQASNGRFVPNLTPDDLLIVESGTPQKIESMKRVPASVLLLLDTGGNLNFAKSLNRTRLTAKVLVESIADGNSLAVLQAYNKIETVAGWTPDRAAVQDGLDRKLFGGNASRFSDSINAAIKMFDERPLENRHLVYIGDALDSVAGIEERQKAFQNLLAANVTVHVIAYNKMEAERVIGATRSFQIGEEREAPRLPDHILEQIIAGLPVLMRDNFRRFAKSERLFIVRLDRKAVKLAKQKREDWMKSETELQAIAEDTGGFFQAPEALETMWLAAQEIAKAVDSQYVVTYIPSKPFADADRTEQRKVRVSTHCSGVLIRARQKIVLYKPAAKKS
jgi:VWFA-related protein